MKFGKMVWWTYLPDKNRDPDIENRLVDTAGKERVGWIERIALKHTHYNMKSRLLIQSYCILQGAQFGTLWQSRGVGWGGREGSSRGRGHIYTYSYCCTEETNSI